MPHLGSTPIIQGFLGGGGSGLREQDHEFKANMGYTV